MKLREAMEKTPLRVPDIARRLARNESTVYQWFTGKLTPDGPETALMMVWFGIGPADLLDIAATPPYALSDPSATPEQRLQAIESVLARLWSLPNASPMPEGIAERVAEVERIQRAMATQASEALARRRKRGRGG